ncbi:porin [Marinobacteraceae bacterium S3BR75-40.1]
MRYLLAAAFAVAALPTLAADFETDNGTVSLEALLMLDYRVYNDPGDLDQTRADGTIRRARATLEHELEDWSMQWQLDREADGAIETSDAYIAYEGWKDLTLTAGRMKEPLGLENQTSSTDLPLTERSLATEAFKTGRHIGLAVNYEDTPYTLSLGGFDISEEDSDNEATPYAFTGRATWAPWQTLGQVLHLGAGYSHREWRGEMLNFDAESGIYDTEDLLETADFSVERQALGNLELGWMQGPFLIESEWYRSELTTSAGDRIAFDGGRVTASFWWGASLRHYDDGRFELDTPAAGAWELALRYSTLDLSDADKDLNAATIDLGLGYYVNAQTRLQLSTSRFESDEDGEKEEGYGAVGRIQYAF